MTNRELREWLGLTVADLLATLGGLAIVAMFFVADPTADVVLAMFGVVLTIAACHFGMKRDPELSEFANWIKWWSYPLVPLLAIGAIIFHYIWFNK